MRDSTYRRLFAETPRQTRIRHNWPHLNHLMTRAERDHQDQILRELRAEERAGDTVGRTEEK